MKLVRMDLAADELTAVLANTNFIFHLAGQPGISATTSPETYIRNNIVATNRLLEASRQLPTLKCFVNISTSSVYGAHATDSEEIPPKPTSYYGVTKLAAEHMVRKRIGSLPVSDGDHLMGIITETDLLRALLAACKSD